MPRFLFVISSVLVAVLAAATVALTLQPEASADVRPDDALLVAAGALPVVILSGWLAWAKRFDA